MVSQKFCNILVECASLQCVYHITEAIQAMVGSIIIGVLTSSALLHSMCDLKAAT